MWQPESMLICCAPNGARRTKADHSAIPEGPEEMGACAVDILRAGAAMLHLHVRDDEGAHSLDPGRYREAMAEIRCRTGDALVVQMTTEAVGRYSPEQQMASVRDVKPEAVSLALGEIVPSEATVAVARAFYAWLNEAEVRVQHILYSAADLDRFVHLWRAGVFGSAAPFILVVLGRYAQQSGSSPSDLLPFMAKIPPEAAWMMCAFGHAEAACAALAATLGGHARIGFENNLMNVSGVVATDNTALIRPVATVAAAIGRPLMTASQLRSGALWHPK